MLKLLSGYKNGLEQLGETNGHDIKNMKIPVFANPNQILDKEKQRYPNTSEFLEILDKASTQPNEPELMHHDSSRMGQPSTISGQVQTPRSEFQYEPPLMEFHRSNSMAADSLGKRASHYENDLLQPPDFRKRSPNEMLMEPLHSPIIHANHLDSQVHSPAHSSGGFKLHASRKNSDLNDLNNDLKLAKKASFEEFAHNAS